jgi:glycosyltransferase involved in cell wall biosynthesis
MAVADKGPPDPDLLRVVVVAPPWYPVPPDAYGGIERVCYDLVQGLVDDGHDVTLVGAGPDGTSARYRPALPDPPRGLGTVEAPVQEVRYAAAVAEVLDGVSADVVHDHSLAGPLLGVSGTRPTLVTAHGPTDGPVGDYYSRLRLPFVATSLAQRKHAPAVSWFATIYNGIPVERFPFRVEKDDYALFLGRLSPEKGAHLAAEAAQKAGVSIVLAGKASEPGERQYLENEVLPQLRGSSTFIGEVHGPQRDELLAGARCLLSPVQWEEPFGLVNVEALACGTPVVALPRGSLPEIVRHGRTGYLCSDVTGLAEGILRADELDATACRTDALDRFDIRVMVRSYEQAYRALRRKWISRR